MPRRTPTTRAGRKSARPGTGRKALRLAGRASRWTGRRVLKPGAKAAGRFAARRGRRTLENLVAVIDDRRVHRAHTGAGAGPKITCGCSDCKGKTWHDRDAFKAHMFGPSSQYAVPATARIGAITPKPKPKPTTNPTTSAATRAAAFWNRSNPGMSQIAALVNAANQVAQMEPQNAEEFEQMLGGLAMAYLRIADSIAEQAEKLDAELGIDPKVTAPLYTGADSLGEMGKAYRNARNQFRSVYAAQLEAMNKGVRQPKNPDFFAA